MNVLIVTRHLGAVEWIKEYGFRGEIKGQIHPDDLDDRLDFVIGVLPIHLAVLALQRGIRVLLIQFPDSPPRGNEYSKKDMEVAGATLMEFCLSWSEIRQDRKWERDSRGIPLGSAGDMQQFRIDLIPFIKTAEENLAD